MTKSIWKKILGQSFVFSVLLDCIFYRNDTCLFSAKSFDLAPNDKLINFVENVAEILNLVAINFFVTVQFSLINEAQEMSALEISVETK